MWNMFETKLIQVCMCIGVDVFVFYTFRYRKDDYGSCNIFLSLLTAASSDYLLLSINAAGFLQQDQVCCCWFCDSPPVNRACFVHLCWYCGGYRDFGLTNPLQYFPCFSSTQELFSGSDHAILPVRKPMFFVRKKPVRMES